MASNSQPSVVRVQTLVDVLVKEPTLYEDPERFCNLLGIDRADFSSFCFRFRNGHISAKHLLSQILEAWIRTNKAVTVKDLYNVLVQENLWNVSEILEEEFSKDCIIQIETKSSKSSTRIWFGMRESRYDFVGREEKLQHLSQFPSLPKLIAISGNGGVGKTEFVLKFAQVFCKDGNWNCIWLCGESDAAFISSIITFASSIGIKISVDATIASYVPKIITKLSTIVFTKTLIIVDNVDDAEKYKSVKEFLSIIGSLGYFSPWIFITSRKRNLLPSWGLKGEMIVLEPLSNDEAISLVRRSLTTASDSDIQKLIKIVQNLPLALQYATSYIKEQCAGLHTGFSITDYLRCWQSDPQAVFDTRPWDMTIEKIQEHPTHGRTAVKLLLLLSFLDPSGVHEDLLLHLFHDLETPVEYSSQQMAWKIIHDAITKEKVRSSSSGGYFESSSMVKPTHALDLLYAYNVLDCSDSILRVHRLVLETIRVKVYNGHIHYWELQEQSPVESINADPHLNFLRQLAVFLGKKTFIQGEECFHFFNVWEYGNSGRALENELKPIPLFMCNTVLNIWSDTGYLDNPTVFNLANLNNFESLDNMKEMKGKIISALKDPFTFPEFIKTMDIVYNGTKFALGYDDPNHIVVGYLYAICLSHGDRHLDGGDVQKEMSSLFNSCFGKIDKQYGANDRKYSLKYFNQVKEWRKCYPVSLYVLQNYQPPRLNTERNLAMCLLGMGLFAEAKVMIKMAVDFQKKTYTENGETDWNLTLLNSRRLLAFIMCQVGEKESAVQLLLNLIKSYGNMEHENAEGEILATEGMLEEMLSVEFVLPDPVIFSRGVLSFLQSSSERYCPCAIL